MAKWKLEETIELVKTLRKEALSFGYVLALGGPMVDQGLSEGQPRLYFIPQDPTQVKQGLIDKLASRWPHYENLTNYPETFREYAEQPAPAPPPQFDPNVNPNPGMVVNVAGNGGLEFNAGPQIIIGRAGAGGNRLVADHGNEERGRTAKSWSYAYRFYRVGDIVDVFVF